MVYRSEVLVRRSITFLLFVGMIALLSWEAEAQTPAPPGRSDCPHCASFGVQRFNDKKEAPFFMLKQTNGNLVTLTELRKKPTLLFFWATWCDACKEEIVLFEKFLKGKEDQLSIVTLVIDGESEKAVQRAMKKHSIGLPVLLDVKEKIARAYGVRMVPTAFLINEEGLVAGMIVGQRDWSSPEAWSAIKEVFNLR